MASILKFFLSKVLKSFFHILYVQCSVGTTSYKLHSQGVVLFRIIHTHTHTQANRCAYIVSERVREVINLLCWPNRKNDVPGGIGMIGSGGLFSDMRRGRADTILPISSSSISSTAVETGRIRCTASITGK